jgi:hypothetical protein
MLKHPKRSAPKCPFSKASGSAEAGRHWALLANLVVRDLQRDTAP